MTGAQNKLKAEIADLHDVAEKMSVINEALALDKVQLNQLVLQVSHGLQGTSGWVYLGEVFFKLLQGILGLIECGHGIVFSAQGRGLKKEKVCVLCSLISFLFLLGCSWSRRIRL